MLSDSDPDVQDLQYDVIHASCADKEVGCTSMDDGNGHLSESMYQLQMDILEVGFTNTDEQKLDLSFKRSDADVESKNLNRVLSPVRMTEVLVTVFLKNWLQTNV